ncbi:MAG: beta-class carbonic anhydrase [Bacteroidales bacterium]
MLDDILAYNKSFVENESYTQFVTTKYPNKELAILTCMDTRLVELLPAATGIKNGDIKLLKNAGGIISHPFGSMMRSLIVAIYQLNVKAIWIIGHDDCGMEHLDTDIVIDQMKQRGITDEAFRQLKACHIDYKKWLSGFDCVDDAVKSTMEVVVNHPLIPHDVEIEGLLINSTTGELKHIFTVDNNRNVVTKD